MSKLFVGIDVGKRTLDALSLDDSDSKGRGFSNDEGGFAKICTWINNSPELTHICMEATGSYWKDLAFYLVARGYIISVVNPACIKAFARSQLKRSKTDKIDARVIADFAKAMNPHQWTPPSPEIAELQSLVRYQQAIQQMRRQELNRLESKHLSKEVENTILKHVEYLDTEEKRILGAITSVMKSTKDLRRMHELLVSIPGIGDKTAAVLLAEIGNIEQFLTSRQLISYAGLCPREIRSGTSVYGKTRLSKVGNAHIRKALFLPAMVGRGCNPHLASLYNRLVAAGKNKKCAIGACMRKLLHLVFVILTKRTPYNPAAIFQGSITV